MKKIIALGCLSYLLIGLAHVVIGSLLEELIAHYQIDYNKGSQLIFNQFAGFLAGVLLTPWLIRIVGRRSTLLIALGTLAVAETVYSLLPPWEIMLIASPVAGFGFGIVEAALGALIIGFVEKDRSSALSMLEVFFGIGALLMPLVAGLLIYLGQWRWSFPVVAAVALLAFVLWALMPFGKATTILKRNEEEARKARPRYPKASLPILAAMILFFLCYVGLEMSIVHFLPSLLIEGVGATTETATLGITAFWTTMVVGRFFAGRLGDRFGYARYLIVCGSGMLVCLILFPFFTTLWLSFAVILLLGLAAAGMFAIGLIYANDRIPGMTERTTSLLVAAGGIGGAFLPRLSGWTMNAFPPSATLALLIALSFLLIALVAASEIYIRIQSGRRRDMAFKA